MKQRIASVVLFATLFVPTLRADDAPAFERKRDVIYGRKFGTCLTMDVFTPKEKPNGAAVIHVVSGGWFSSHDGINPNYVAPFVKRGYTVFAVVHGSNPRYTIPDAIADMNRAVRFIRHNAKDFGIDGERLGITGGSAGGHLSLMQGLAGDAGDPKARDAVEQKSSRTQAVACFYPPTDFLNYGSEGKDVVSAGLTKRSGLKAPFDFADIDEKTRAFAPITDPEKIREKLMQISPITHVSSDDPPVLIMHGDKDTLVPIQQAEVLINKLKEAKVPAELVVKKGGGHGWGDLIKDLDVFADWFDKHLKKKGE